MYRWVPLLVALSACGGGAADDPAPVAAVAPGQEIPCPAQTNTTLVLFVAGQSNASNSGQQNFDSAYGAQVVNFADGKCTVAQSPLRGATDVLGNSWVLLGNKLAAAGSQVIIAPYAVSGSSVIRWAADGDLHPGLLTAISGAGAKYRVTHFLWHQGEADFRISGEDYTRLFYSMTDSLRAHGFTAPIYASVATRCGDDPGWQADNPIATAQRALPDVARGILAGVDTDTLIPLVDRRDGCHFAASGQEKFAAAWFDLLTH